MEMSRRLVNLIGAAAIGLILILGFSAVAWPLFSVASGAARQASGVAQTNGELQAELDHQMEMANNKAALEAEVARLHREIPFDEELRDVSAVASGAASTSGARIVSIEFGDAQVFAAPTGGGIGTDGKPAKAPKPADANTIQVQIPVTIEAEAGSATQATEFVDGLRTGYRLMQFVQVDTSQTTDPSRYAITIDALIFSQRD